MVLAFELTSQQSGPFDVLALCRLVASTQHVNHRSQVWRPQTWLTMARFAISGPRPAVIASRARTSSVTVGRNRSWVDPLGEGSSSYGRRLLGTSCPVASVAPSLV